MSEYEVAPEVAPADEVEPWQRRLEVLAALLVGVVAVVLVAATTTAISNARRQRTFSDDGLDIVGVLQVIGRGVGLAGAGALVVALVLVLLAPGGPIRRLGMRTLAGLVVVGLLVAGVCGFSASAYLVGSTQSSRMDVPTSNGSTDLIQRLGIAAPLVMATALAVYVAWCAFQVLPIATVGADEDADADDEDDESDTDDEDDEGGARSDLDP